ncbi:hypothetical protein D3C77_618730 [compost metagenome]
MIIAGDVIQNGYVLFNLRWFTTIAPSLQMAYALQHKPFDLLHYLKSGSAYIFIVLFEFLLEFLHDPFTI